MELVSLLAMMAGNGEENWDEDAVQEQVDNANQIADSADLSDCTDLFVD